MGFLKQFKPSESYDSFSTINLDKLKAQGINVMLIDVDCTVIEFHGNHVPKPNKSKLEEAKRKGFTLYALTNSTRDKEILQILKIPAITNAKKPLTMGFKRIQRLLNCSKKQMVMIGDRITADIFGGNIFGIKTIYVKPIMTNLPWYYRLLIQFENFMYFLVK
jgi:HAD superfamily phosphatase (TIGR01668 family)